MPNINDIVELAGALEYKAVMPVENRCVVVRNRNAKCRKCVQACPVDAIEVANNVIALNNSVCVSCGACTVVCPTEALVSLSPLDDDLAKHVADACLATDRIATIACARISSRREADPEHYAEVPCLARVEESLLLELAAQSAQRIVLVDGTCQTCKYRACDAGISATVDSANALLAMVGEDMQVERTSAFPEPLLLQKDSDTYASSRRNFFTQARSIAKDATEKTIEHALEGEKAKKVQSLRERLKVTDGGTLPQFSAIRHMNALDALDRLGEPISSHIDTRLWGCVSIDSKDCSACDMCTIFCPTGALRKSEGEEGEDERETLEFSLADCVQCNACADICLKKCLTVSTVIPTAELFDFEPRMIDIPKTSKKGGFPAMNRY